MNNLTELSNKYEMAKPNQKAQDFSDNDFIDEFIANHNNESSFKDPDTSINHLFKY